MVTDRLGRARAPRTLPFSSSMSASAASSRCAAICFALSASLRDTIAVAAPPTGVERDAYVPRPYGVLSVSPSHHLDVAHRDAELVGDDLGERRLVALALRLHAELEDRLAGRVHAQLGGVDHLEAEDVVLLRRPRADRLGEVRDADADEPALGARRRPAPRAASS